jgi:hypothetical protein
LIGSKTCLELLDKLMAADQSVPILIKPGHDPSQILLISRDPIAAQEGGQILDPEEAAALLVQQFEELEFLVLDLELFLLDFELEVV